MEAEQARWQQRHDTYMAQRRTLEARMPDPDQRRQALEQWLRQHDAEGELAAARAYERERQRP